jgi:hypothetical protein
MFAGRYTYMVHSEAADVADELDARADWPEQPRRWQATTEEYDAWEAAREIESQRSGVAAAVQRAADLWLRVLQLEDEMARGDSEGLIGALVRARVLATRVAPGSLPVDAKLAAILESDLERLVATAGVRAPQSDERVTERLEHNKSSTSLLKR